MNKVHDVIDQLFKFSDRVLTINDGVSDDAILDFERKHSLVLPRDYKLFLKRTNGLNLMGTVILGICEEPVYLSLIKVFDFEHYQAGNAMPGHLLPFSPDGWGNHYCFDTTKCDDQSCEVVFWQHDCAYTEEDPRKPSMQAFLIL